MVARRMRKMHVPAYCPVLDGVHAFEYREVAVEVKNVIWSDIVADEDMFMSILNA